MTYFSPITPMQSDYHPGPAQYMQADYQSQMSAQRRPLHQTQNSIQENGKSISKSQNQKHLNQMPFNHKGEQTPPRAVPFESAQEAWFWFIDAQQAKEDGARITAGQGLVPRPCEPLDIFHVVDRLYRNRRLIWDHMLVLRHYGLRKMAPDPYRSKEAKAATLWAEAMQRLEEAFIRKCIVAPPRNTPFHDIEKGSQA